MFAVILVCLAYIYGLQQVVFHGFRIGGSLLLTAAVFLVAFMAIAFWLVHHLGKPSRKQQAAAQAFFDAVVKDKKQP